MRHRTLVLIALVLYVILLYIWYPPNALQTLVRDGVLCIDGAIPMEICRAAIPAIRQALCASSRSTSAIPRRTRRIDVHLNVDNPAVRALFDALRYKYADVWTEYLGDSNPRINEWSCLATHTGAPAQGWHRDGVPDKTNPPCCWAPNPTKQARMISVGVALTDIDESMGPLEAIPKTHCTSARSEPAHVDAFPPDAVKMTCGVGGIVVWDAAVIHRGGKNASQHKTRAVPYISLRSSCGKTPDGPAFSMLPELKKRRLRLYDAD